MKSGTKFGVLSNSLPPSTVGQAIILYRLLHHINTESYFLLSKEKYIKPEQIENSLWLPVKYHWVGDSLEEPFPDHNILKIIRHFFILTWIVINRVIKVCDVIRQENCRVLIACSGSIFDIFWGFFASKLTGIKFIAYNFDDYVYQSPTKKRRFFLNLVTPFVFRFSEEVIVPNEYLQMEYQRRYKINSVVIHNPIDDYPPLQEVPWPFSPDIIRIVYTGSIYAAHYDVFQNLVKALEILNRPIIQLHLYTSQTREFLAEHGLIGDFTIHLPTPSAEIYKIQRQADILFLGLAFNSPYPQVIRTSAPGKMGEYLASGRPVLAHVPADSFVASYFKNKNCGWVAEQNNPKHLATVISNLILDQESRTAITCNAVRQAKIDFSPEIARDQFLRLMCN